MVLITICGLDLSYSMLKVFPSKHCEEKGTWLNCLFEKKIGACIIPKDDPLLSSPLDKSFDKSACAMESRFNGSRSLASRTYKESSGGRRAGAFSGNCLRRQTYQKDKGEQRVLDERFREQWDLTCTNASIITTPQQHGSGLI